MKILLAVSGGIDSMYLANRSLEDAGDLFGVNDIDGLAVAHCNFALRGKESDGDEAFVREWCDTHGIRCFVHRFDTRGYASEKGISIEMAARELRYEWFRKLCSQEVYDRLAVAHNANDNAETLMLNLLRGTGLKGIRGMDASGEWILRPMLGLSRADIRAWMESRGLSWREDSSNSSDEYKRNIIRNEIFPIFSRINPSFLETLCKDMAHFAQADDFAGDYVNASGINADNIDTKKLLGFKHWKFILFRLTGDKLNSSQFESLCECLEKGAQLSGKCFGPFVGSSGRLLLTSDGTSATAPEWEIVRRDQVNDLRSKDYIFLDADKMGDSPSFRHWNEGDWMVPMGMKGRKKLSDIFNDLGWSIPQKKAALLVAYPGDDSRVAALLCGRPDESMKVTALTSHVLKIKKQAAF